ncbi:aldose epimerase family protein [Niabella beijingensis]|uniref:aldose epimerase family protein n=1 Tax=Niabella beijingensis TaxID=2872700 RepID=UPI001CC0A7CE|nr:aldose epimerase family protein [Niabella beijingensis]MBZ4191183.1 galactose mutarotase [Niabella beijingensis]
MIEITEQLATQHPNGKDVYIFTLKNGSGTEVILTNYGAIIMSIKVRKSDGTFNDIVLGFDTPQEYWSERYLQNYPYYGAAIGRYANRISPELITIGAADYTLNTVAPGYQLHGGKEGFDKKVWDKISAGDGRVVLQYISPDGEEGFPGNLTVQIIFSLNEENEFSYEYKATTDQPTAVNLTHHSYFNLNNGKGRIDNQHLCIHASHYLEQDANYCTTGKLLPVTGTRNDFSTYQETGNISDPEQGIDISYPLDHPGIEQVAAEAWCDEEDVKLEVYTTAPLVHLYNSYGSPEIKGKGGQQYTAFSGFCFETQVHPNAINIASFPNTILEPGAVSYTKTIYKLTTK